MNIRVIYSHLLRIVADEQVCEPDRILTFRFRFHLISIHSGIILARTIIRIILSQKCLSFARCSVISSIGNEIISVMECIIGVHFTGVTIDSRKIENRFFSDFDYLKSGRRRRICIQILFVHQNFKFNFLNLITMIYIYILEFRNEVCIEFY